MSITDTVLERALATYSLRPAGVSASAVGFDADRNGGHERIGGRRSTVDVQHRHRAVHGVGDIAAGAVGGKGHAVGLLADGNFGQARISVLQVEERDAVVVRIGDEQERIVRAQRQRLRTGGAGEAGQRLCAGMPEIAVAGTISPRQ